MTDTLKPCPFCGGEAKLTDCRQAPEAWVECIKCGARTRFFGGSSEAPVSAWNIRQVEDDEIKYEPTSYSCRACKNATDNEIKRLREALEKIRDKAELEESKASNATYGFAYDIEYIAREALKSEEQ